MHWSTRLIGLALLVAIIGFAPSIYQDLRPQTAGSIYVSGPQVYTRERLVNDRYREDAWLINQLDAQQSFGATSTIIARQATTFSATAVAAGAGSASPPGGAKDASASGPKDTSPSGGKDMSPSGARDPSPSVGTRDLPPIKLSPFQTFDAAATYREHVRTLLIENQLDDRHDLRGNSLYRLRFDAAILPGDNTRASARITVSILPPENLVTDGGQGQEPRQEEEKLANLSDPGQLSLPEQAVWRRIYQRWLDSLGKRFEDGRKSVRTAYETGRFTPDDYELLIKAATGAIDEKGVAVTALLGTQGLPAEVPGVSSDLLGKFRRGRDALIAMPDARKDAVAQFRDAYTKGDLSQTAPGHAAYKDQIRDLIETVRQETNLSTYLAIRSQSAGVVTLNPLTGGTVAASPAVGCGDLGSYGKSAVPPPAAVDYSLAYFLDVAFEGDLANAILGLQPSQMPAGGGSALNGIAILAPLTVADVRYGGNGQAFTFRPQTASLVMTDNAACFPTGIEHTSYEVVAGKPVHVSTLDAGRVTFLVPSYDIGGAIARELDGAAWLAPHAAGQAHVVTHTVEAGLINFIRAAGRRMDAFSYAFTPSEPDEIAATQSMDEQDRSLAATAPAGLLGALGSGMLRLGQQSSRQSSRNELRKMVVPFGMQSSSAAATFGWVIQPQDPSGLHGSYHQRASQTALTALISLPAWWEVVHVRVEGAWVPDDDGPARPVGQPQDYTIELPVNFETVDASLFDTNDRSPVINQWATDEVIVRACMRADIVIPGRRLWRSTVVMLGGQRASQIFVLPDMNGIVATFDPVAFPDTWSDLGKDYLVPLTVWTSEGSTSLPIPARFSKLGAGEQPGCPGPAMPAGGAPVALTAR